MALTLDTLKQAYDAIVDRGWSNVSLTDIAKATDIAVAADIVFGHRLFYCCVLLRGRVRG